MRIGILSRERMCYSTKRLVETCRARGHQVRIFDTLAFSIHLEQSKPSLSYKHKVAPKVQAIIPRIGASITFFGCAVVRQFEQMGVRCLNSAQGITASRDKLRSMQALSRHEVGIVTSAFVRRREDVLAAIESVGGAPLVIKLLEGTHGVGVMLADTNKIAEAMIETVQSAKQSVLIQKFISESRGRDLRVIVVGGQVIAAMRRVAAGDEFRSNVHRGGKVVPVASLDADVERTAIRAAQILGLNVAGVDILETNAGPKVMEVNSSPGLEGIECATGLDVAGKIIDFVEAQSVFADVDLHERLTLERGYGIVEILVDKKSKLHDVSIQDSALREQDIVVLRITRGGTTISNPFPHRELCLGDILLCFGKLVAMQSILERSRRTFVRKKRGAKSQGRESFNG